MARNITLNFGLLSVPMKSDVATVTAVELRNLCVGQPGPEAPFDVIPHEPNTLNAPTICKVCGPVTDKSLFVKGIPTGAKDEYTVVSQDDLLTAKETYTRLYKGAITLVPHDAGTVLAATAPGKTLHYLTPASAASADHYALLAKLIGAHQELAFMGLHTPTSATSLYRVTTREGVLVLEQRVREQGVKPVPSVGGTVNEQFYAMLEMSLPMLTTPYAPEGYEDGYAAAVEAMRATAPTVGTAVASALTTDDDLIAKFAALTTTP